jgi:hypothetical protein
MRSGSVYERERDEIGVRNNFIIMQVDIRNATRRVNIHQIG